MTHQLLTSPALWRPASSLTDTLRFISIFQTAAARIIRNEKEQRARKEQGLAAPPNSSQLSRSEWLRSVIKGADDRSPVGRHVLVFAGLLIGLCGQDGSQNRQRALVEHALVRATNMALEEARDEAPNIALALNYSFELLSDLERSRISYDKLLPVLLGVGLFSQEGLTGYFLHGINADISVAEKIAWSEQSPSFQAVKLTSQKPLVTTLGPLARLVAHTITQLQAPWLVQTAIDDLVSFSRTLEQQWQQCKLSEVDGAQEKTLLNDHTLHKTVPLLWRLLRSTLFAITIILRGVMARLMNDRALANDEGMFPLIALLSQVVLTNLVAPAIATQTLLILSHLSFILTHHATPSSFTQYTFVNLAAIDILSAYPSPAASLLTSLLPQHPDRLTPHHQTRTLFYLNTAEHFTLTLTPSETSTLLLPPALAHLHAPNTVHHLDHPIFEAAHALFLAILSAPQNSQLAAEYLPFYADHLFTLFPTAIQPRQFRLAIKTLVRVSSPPNPLAVSQPDMAPTLLELVRGRASDPSVTPTGQGPSPSETLLLALSDSLSVLAPGQLEEWLPLTAEAITAATGLPTAERDHCRARFWEVMSREMDVERGEICAAWWGTQGREMLLREREGEGEVEMSGGLSRL